MSDKDLVEISQTGTRDLLLLADKDPLRAEKITNSLPFSQRMSLVLNASGKDREHLILMARDAEKIVKSLPAEEFYYTINFVPQRTNQGRQTWNRNRASRDRQRHVHPG